VRDPLRVAARTAAAQVALHERCCCRYRKSSYARSVAHDPDDLYDGSDFDDLDFVDSDFDGEPIRRSRAVRWTAILIVASFALAGLSSLVRWW